MTNPEAEEAPPTREERIEEAARVLIAGHPRGAVRRIILYGVMAGAFALNIDFVAQVAFVLLVATDNFA